jgi:hypothetical protein
LIAETLWSVKLTPPATRRRDEDERHQPDDALTKLSGFRRGSGRSP